MSVEYIRTYGLFSGLASCEQFSGYNLGLKDQSLGRGEDRSIHWKPLNKLENYGVKGIDFYSRLPSSWMSFSATLLIYSFIIFHESCRGPCLNYDVFIKRNYIIDYLCNS